MMEKQNKTTTTKQRQNNDVKCDLQSASKEYDILELEGDRSF